MTAPEGVSLRIGWWNTSLRCTEPQAGHFEATGRVLEAIWRFAPADVIFLGETVRPHFDGLRRHLNMLQPGTEWRIRVSPRNEEVRIGVLFNASKVDVDPLKIAESPDGAYAVTRQVITKVATAGAPPIHVVAAHWPSRLHDANQRLKRDRMGEIIRRRFADLVRRSSVKGPYLLVIGDFNDEPFDRSVAEQIGSTREREFACTKPREFLYNPFWRHLGEATPGPDDAAGPLGAGTYFYRRGGPTNRWYTFDQVLVSAAFLRGAPGWELDEDSTRPLRPPGLVDSIVRDKAPFDHVPIVAKFRHTVPAT